MYWMEDAGLEQQDNNSVRSLARRLVGVDLSTKMLSYARRTSAYKDLSEMELVQFLELHPQQFDVCSGTGPEMTATYAGADWGCWPLPASPWKKVVSLLSSTALGVNELATLPERSEARDVSTSAIVR